MFAEASLNLTLPNGEIQEAILDTDSQMNLLHDNLYEDLRGFVSLTPSIKATMRGATGKPLELIGGIKDLETKFCGVAMHGDFFLVKNVPFNMLLRRPWMKANKVRTEERNDGTYVVFPDEEGQIRKFATSRTPGRRWNNPPSNEDGVNY